MRGAYSEIYLDDAMRNMGEMVEYGEEACGLDQDLLLRMFVRSGYADRWEKGDPRVICGLSGTELCRRLLEATYADRGAEPAPLVRYDTGEAYWRGFALAYYQWRSGRTFPEILAFIGGKDLQRMYPAYHTASEEKTADELEALLRRRGGKEPVVETSRIVMTHHDMFPDRLCHKSGDLPAGECLWSRCMTGGQNRR